ncbi:MAG: PH domain-containing protein [Oscillospiraceae bacterium]|nr:PH domain-containing protein [Oscillospiraceae bacterium]
MDNKVKKSKKYDEIVWKGRKRRLGLPLSFTRYILTPTKLFTSTGFFNIDEERTELYRIIDFSLKLSLGQRIFGCGTIIVHSKDKTCPEMRLNSVKNPRTVMRLIEEYVEQQRLKYNIHGRDMVGVSGSFYDSTDSDESNSE